METINHKEILLKKLESMVDNWYKGDVKASQKDHQYMMGYCESAKIDFNNLITKGIQYLKNQCVGIHDTAKYTAYINGII